MSKKYLCMIGHTTGKAYKFTKKGVNTEHDALALARKALQSGSTREIIIGVSKRK